MELREYVRGCRRRWIWPVAAVLLAAGFGAAFSLSVAPVYRSSAMLSVTTGVDDADARTSRLNSYLALLTGPRVAQGVAAKLTPRGDAETIRRSLSARVEDGTDLLVVSATDPNAARSRAMVSAATAMLVQLTRQLDPPGRVTGGTAARVTVAQGPVTTRVSGMPVRDVGRAAVLGLVIGAVAAAVRAAIAPTVSDEEGLRRLGLRTAGVISLGGTTASRGSTPRGGAGRGGTEARRADRGSTARGRVEPYGAARGGAPAGGADQALVETFRLMRCLLPDLAQLRRDGAPGTSLLITGPRRREGVTATACGLALAVAETGARVALVDANLRTPAIGRYFALGARRGLGDVLSGAGAVPEVLTNPLAGRLAVLPSGDPPADPGLLLASPLLATTMRYLTERYDLVLVDGPPMAGTADAAVLAKVTDGAVLVVRTAYTRTADVRSAADLLERAGAGPVVAVLNALPRRLPTDPLRHPPVIAPDDRPADQPALRPSGDPARTPGDATEINRNLVRGTARVTAPPPAAPAKPDPARPDPAKRDPASVGSAMPDLAKRGPASVGSAMPDLAKRGPASVGSAKPDPANPGPANPGPANPDLANPDLANPGPAIVGPPAARSPLTPPPRPTPRVAHHANSRSPLDRPSWTGPRGARG